MDDDIDMQMVEKCLQYDEADSKIQEIVQNEHLGR